MSLRSNLFDRVPQPFLFALPTTTMLNFRSISCRISPNRLDFMPGAGLYIEEALLDVLEETDLVQFQNILCIDLHLRCIDHFEHAKDKDLIAHGIPPPAVRRLRVALADKRARKAPLVSPSLAHQSSSSNRKRDSDAMMRPNNENVEPASTPETVIYKEQIKLMERLGEGSFAVVKRAYWTKPNGQKLDVAVKILRDASPLVVEELQAEAANLRRLQHPNLIQLYGVVEQPAMMVLELCPGGSLLDRLRERQKGTLLISQLLDYCRQMCKGMTYLETKHCVHRDLAARNMLLSADEKTVKICDFGLMRCLEENERLYVMSPQKKVPFAWCPPEALRHRQFSHASDVWSMGVAMWEIFTYGEEPWVGLKGIDVLRKVEAGDRLEKPRKCSIAIYDLMLLCWKINPDHRPRFNLLRGFLNQAEMSTAVVRDAYDSQEEGALYLENKDQVVVIEKTGVLWFGQSLRTRLFGSFPRSHVFMESEQRRETSERSAGGSRNGSTSSGTPRKMGGMGGHANITLPIKGSFIHAGHGDISGRGWGSPNLIDEIYLKNPVMGQPLVALGHSSHSASPSIVPLPPPNKPATLNISSGKALNLHLDSPDSFDEFQNEDISPSNIRIPAPLNGLGRPSTGLQPTRAAPSRPVSVVAPPAPPRLQQQQLHPPHPYYEPPAETPRGPAPTMQSAFGGGGIPLTPINNRDYGIAPVPRPPGNGRSQSASRAINNTPPPISANAYVNRNTPPLSTSSGLSSILRPSNGHSPALNNYGGSSSNGTLVMDELAARLLQQQQRASTHPSPAPSNLSSNPGLFAPSTSTGGGGTLSVNDSVQWRSSPRETPLLNHSQMNTMRGVSYAPQSGADPFMVSDAIRTLSQPRRSEIIDSSMRLPFPSYPSAPPSTSTSNLPKTSSTPAFNPSLLSSQPLQPSVLPHPVSNPPSHRSSSVHTAAPATTALLQPLQPLPVQQQQPLQRPPPQQQQQQPQPKATPITQPQASQPRPAAVPLQPVQQSRPMAAPSSSSSSTARHSTMQDEISSLLPTPSALFYGSSNPSSARSSPLTTGHQPQPQTTSSSSSSFPSSMATSTAAAATRQQASQPAEAPFSSSVLKPTRIGSAAPAAPATAPTPPTQPINAHHQQPTVYQQQQQSQISAIQRPYGLENGNIAQMPLFAIQNSSRTLNSLSTPAYTTAYSTPTGGYGMMMPGYGDASAMYGGYGAYGAGGYGNGFGGYGYGGYGGGGGYGIGGSIGGGGGQTLIYAAPNNGVNGGGPRSALPPALGPASRSGIEVPENASAEDVIRLLDPLSSRSTPTPAAAAAPAATRATAAAGATRPPSPGRQAAELEGLYAEAFFTDRKRCDFMVARLGGRVDLALRELKKEYLVDTGIARDKQHSEMALIAKDWNLNSAADAILTGAL
ncbi:hypothetical protein PENTCL1PPCAC_26112 [Pristionchus entomophagus]|uniref:non-specific protein-tyrosine kinase n=1 Tax=Pristionchus entomophagus TaxID=358040 RepID=A0AAV5UC63_9BILA|nr:hypothetical protein PENTCL1PPCAC_26112 [Pristionchus entomophagus]